MTGWFSRLRLKLRETVRGNRSQDVHDELSIHLEFLEEEYRAAGMAADESRAAARRQFGNTTHLQEQSRDLFSFRFVEDLWRDAAIALRTILKGPGFALVVIGALTVGVGANVTVFGFVNALLLRPLDAAEPGRLVRAYSDGT